jgi:hypothetical protein
MIATASLPGAWGRIDQESRMIMLKALPQCRVAQCDLPTGYPSDPTQSTVWEVGF